jgi:hypothetical protein
MVSDTRVETRLATEDERIANGMPLPVWFGTTTPVSPMTCKIGARSLAIGSDVLRHLGHHDRIQVGWDPVSHHVLLKAADTHGTRVQHRPWGGRVDADTLGRWLRHYGIPQGTYPVRVERDWIVVLCGHAAADAGTPRSEAVVTLRRRRREDAPATL